MQSVLRQGDGGAPDRCSEPVAVDLARALICCLALGLGAGAVAGAAATPPLPGQDALVSQEWTVQKGLPHDAVLAISQTADGYLWLATHAGLARFDGLRFKVFTGGNTEGLVSSDVRVLAPSGDGGLWIGTFGGGLSHLSGGSIVHVLGAADWLPSTQITALLDDGVDDGEGRLWIGTPQGLSRMRDGRVERFGAADGLPGSEILSLARDRQGRIYIGTSRGLAVFRDGPRASFAPVALPVDAPVEALLATDDGALWIGTSGAGLYRRDDSGVERVTAGERSGLLSIQCLLQDRAGDLWVGTPDGVVRLDGSTHRPKDDRTRRDGVITALFQDREGGLWLGTHSHGLRRLGGSTVGSYTHRKGWAGGRIWSVTADAGGDLWAATGEGVVRLRDGAVFGGKRLPGEVGRVVRSILADGRGGLWLGTLGNGLERLRGDRITPAATPAELGSDTVRALYRSRDGTVWIGTEGGGLSRLVDGQVERLPASEARLRSATVTSLADGPAGGIWAGTFEQGLLRVHDGRVTRSRLGDEIHEGILSLCSGAEGSLWIGTVSGALLRLRNGRVESLVVADGLPFGALHAILDDRRGFLWISSNRGVFRVAKAELEQLARGERDRLSWRSFDAAEGLPGGECTGGGQPTAWRAPDGRLWFSTVEGLGVIDPGNLARPAPAPPVVIERLVADGRRLGRAELPALPLGTSRVEIAYTAPTFRAPERVRFRTRLVGFDRDWVLASSRRVATYTSLEPGHYTFEVAARRPDGEWSRRPARIELTLPAPFYRRSAFQAVVAACFVALLWGVYRLRIHRLRLHHAVLAERHRVSRDVHDSLSQGLTGIVLQLEAAERRVRDETAGWNIHRAREIARDNLASVQRVVAWLRCDELGTMRLDEALRYQALTMAEEAKLAVEFQEHGTRRELPRAMAEDVYRIVGEALTNAVRHAGASLIEIRTVWGWRALTIVVRDDGSGFSLPDRNRAFESAGLRGMMERAELWRGRLEIYTAPGEGTEVTVKIPLSVMSVLGPR